MDDLPGAARQPVCEAESDRTTGEAAARMVPSVEAIRCADVGPLLVRRAHFLEAGGFNESGTVRGEPGSVNVDCELEARMWGRGYATVYLGLEGKERWTHSEERRAWRHPRMAAGHYLRRRRYWEMYEQPGTRARLNIERQARAMNGQFTCPTREALARKPRTKFDCYITQGEGTCEV